MLSLLKNVNVESIYLTIDYFSGTHCHTLSADNFPLPNFSSDLNESKTTYTRKNIWKLL